MPRHLVIVESVTKTETIRKLLGKDFIVFASYGHVRDLVAKTGAVDPENDFHMRYATIERNVKHVDKIAKALADCEDLYLAPDPDREGEAIAWHIYELLKMRGALKDKKVYRVSFNQITRDAVRTAVDTPREISMDLVNAQQARRALDYLVGFNLSPLLWRKIMRGLSAGRVQSPALRMIVERQREIEAFIPQEYWSIRSENTAADQNFSAKLTHLDGEKLQQFSITNEKQANAAVADIIKSANGELEVLDVKQRERKRKPAPPFITSSLQQEAVRKLGYSAKRTMRLAQQLYEGVDLGAGVVGLITYMRTDSVNMAEEAVVAIREQICNQYGKENCPDAPRTYKSKVKNAQEAHEAIRPADITKTPQDVRQHMDSDLWRLYALIWKRAMASQMIDALIGTVSVDLGTAKHVFRASGSTVIAPGFMSVYREGVDDKPAEDDEKFLPDLKVKQKVQVTSIEPHQHFTEPPPRYNEASLVKKLEEHGIGRPSTYAAIISTLQARDYVEMNNKRFVATDVGCVVCDFLTKNFATYVDYEFTADLENQLDDIANGSVDWLTVLTKFWEPFNNLLGEVDSTVTRAEALQSRELGVDPVSGRPVSVRMGRFGPFVQKGQREDTEKPLFAGLPPGKKIADITLEEALFLFRLPRDLGVNAEDQSVIIGIGRFGPYVKVGKEYASIPETEDPYTIELEPALKIFAEHKASGGKKVIIEFPEKSIQVLNGRYGPYITDGKKNARIPKDEEPGEITLERAEELLAKAKVRGKGGFKRKK